MFTKTISSKKKYIRKKIYFPKSMFFLKKDQSKSVDADVIIN